MSLVLSLSILTSGVMQSVSFASGAEIEKLTTNIAVDLKSAAASDKFLTVSGIMNQFQVTEEWLDKQLSQGYTLYEISNALQEGQDHFEKNISRYKQVRQIDQQVRNEQSAALTPLLNTSIAASSYDQTALEQLGLSNATSAYEVAYGMDAIDASTGEMKLRMTDLMLPGALPFSLTRVYDSSRASEKIGVGSENGAYVNRAEIRREERDSALGRGWRWELPFIEEQGDQWIMDFPGIGRYRLSENLELQGYPWNDVQVSFDASQTVDGVASSFKISLLNGTHYYFSAAGYLILIADNYGNQVKLHYSTHNSGNVLSRISNSDGNELTFVYTDGKITVSQTGTNKKVDYFTSIDNEQPVLSEVKDAIGRSSKYFYSFPESEFNLLESLKDQGNLQGTKKSALLVRILHPSSATTEFDYISSRKFIGPYAIDTVFKLKSREDAYSTEVGDVVLQPAEFSYSGEELNSYGQSAAFTTVIEDVRSQETLSFEKTFQGEGQPDIIYLKEQLSEDATTGLKRQFTYSDTAGWNIPVAVTESYRQGGSESQPLTINYQYNELGQVLSENWSTGQETLYNYMLSPAPFFWSLPEQVDIKVSDEKKRIQRYSYNDQGDVKQVTIRENSASGKLLAQSDLEYDAYGNLIASKTKDDQRTNTVNYSYASPYGKHLLSEQSMVIRAMDGTSSVSKQSFTYNAAGELITSTDEAGAVTAFAYDALGRMVKTTYSDQSTTTVQYDDEQRTVTTTSPEGITTTQRYSPHGFVVREIVDDAIFQYGYDEAGNLDLYKDAEGNQTIYTHDGFRRQTKAFYADGSQSSAAYDMVNRTVTTTDPAGVKQQQTFDLVGNTLAAKEWKDGMFVTLGQAAYDLAGNVLSEMDGEGQQTQYQYDALGRIISVTDAEQRVTRYTYSLAGDLTRVEYPDGIAVRYEYDEAGKLIRQINEEGMVEAFFYDSRGNLTKYLDHASQTTQYQYNSDNLLTKIVAPGEEIAYTYDSLGRRTGMTDSTGTTTYHYDPADGSLVTMGYPDGTRIDYTYNKQIRTGYTLTDAKGQAAGASYTIDGMNRVSSLAVVKGNAANGAKTSSITAAAPGSLATLDQIAFDYQLNGLLEQGVSSNGVGTAYSYDGYDLTGMTVSAGALSVTRSAQERMAVEESEATATEATYTRASLSMATGHTFKYEYDLNKNIVGRTQNGVTDNFTYDLLNRIHTESGEKNKTYTYDQRGNIQNIEGRELRGLSNADFTFNSLNRLTKVKTEDGIEVSYTYNGDGLLYERLEGNSRTRYYYDEAAKLIAEADVSSGTPSLTYTYIYDLSGRLWSRVDHSSSQVQYYQLNGHGDVVGLTDSQGQQLNAYTYDIWGNPETEEETVPNIFRYSGEYWDSTTDLQYLRARWYDPNAGRFVSKDPYQGSLDNPLSLNRYSYVESNPLVYVDPSGNIISRADAETLLEIAGAEGANSDVWWLIRSHLGSEAKYDPMSVLDENNRFKYLFNLATGNHYIEEENTPENASWAKAELLEMYEKNAERAEAIIGLSIGMFTVNSKGSKIGAASSNATKTWIKRSTYKEIGKSLGKRAQMKFSNAMKKGLVGAEGSNGVKLFSGKGIEVGGKFYKYEVKVKGDFGAYRALGNYDKKSGHIIFDIFEKTHK
ncbi:hypothetical protein J41TS12_11630 [Paenibacillus antibioticophila]|uniref:RHS repeat-associated core domain-containing protein n=2 Tax=Paenibacillus antibioticophila TaxID=1274374 RepID=A0A919XNI9_9BACL|nr:hypothetical protein J41TS12_11630 [Paenibacillus antibioticophila]